MALMTLTSKLTKKQEMHINQKYNRKKEKDGKVSAQTRESIRSHVECIEF